MINFELRKWETEDAKSVAIAANNPAIAANLRNAFPYPYTLEDAAWYVNDCIEKGNKIKLQEQLLWMARLWEASVSSYRTMYTKNQEN